MKMSKIILSNHSKTTNTTTINLGGVRHNNEKNRCIIKSISTSQPSASKIPKTLGHFQPKVITLSSSLSASNSTNNTTTSQPSTPSNTIVKPLHSSLVKKTSIPHQILPTKVVNIPIKSNMQPMKINVNATIASSGQTGHTMILKKAGKIETFPVPSSTPNQVSNSIVKKDYEKENFKQEVITNSLEKVEGNISNPSKTMMAKAIEDDVDERRETDNQSLPVTSAENINASKETEIKQNPVVSTITFKHSSNIPQTSNSKSDTSLQQAAPDSTSCSVEPLLENSKDQHIQIVSKNQQQQNSFSSQNQNCVIQSKLNSNSTKIGESEIIQADENPKNVINSSRQMDQDSSINSSNESVVKDHEKFINVSSFSTAPLKRSSSEAIVPSDRRESDINQLNEKKTNENSSIFPEQDYPAAKKSKL